ncbi:glycerol-3-phosphate acyltransferase [bacterium]|nr:glycerol-3-phosphate acyltransferase [bacterium]
MIEFYPASEKYFLAVVFGYITGTFPTAFWLGKYVYRLNIFEHGSRNMGATNVYRVLGLKPFIFTLFVDITKGLIPVLIAGSLNQHSQEKMLLMIVVGVAVIFWVLS